MREKYANTIERPLCDCNRPQIDSCSEAIIMAHQYFFATKEDMASNLATVHAALPLKYALHEMRGDLDFTIIERPEEWPNLGFNETGDEVDNPQFILLPVEQTLRHEEVELRNGKTNYFLHVGVNPHGFIFSPGGLVTGKGLVAGHVWRNREVAESEECYRQFSKLFFSGFKSYKGYRIGPEAYRMWKAGTRLAPRSLMEDKKFDLA